MIGVLVVDDDFMVARIHTRFVEQTEGFEPVHRERDRALGEPDLVRHEPHGAVPGRAPRCRVSRVV